MNGKISSETYIFFTFNMRNLSLIQRKYSLCIMFYLHFYHATVKIKVQFIDNNL